MTTGIRLLSAYLPALPARVAALSASCARYLESLRWPRSGAPAVRVLSRIPGMPPEAGEAAQGAGGIVSCLMLNVRASYNINESIITPKTHRRSKATLSPSRVWQLTLLKTV